MGAVIAIGNHGNTPPGHGRGGVQLRGLQEAAFGFAGPEGVHLGNALFEELAGLRVGRGDGEIDLSLPFQQAGGELGRALADNHAVAGGIDRALSGQQQRSKE